MPRNRSSRRHEDNASASNQAEFSFNSLEVEGVRPGLVLSDPTPLRQEWLKRYHEIERKLGKLKSDWRRFEDEAHTGFQQWYHQVFFEELSLLTELGEQIREKQSFFTAIEVNKRVYRLSDKQAYRKVMKALDEKRDPFPDPEDLERCRREETEEREALLEARRLAREELKRQFQNQDFVDEDFGDEHSDEDNGDSSKHRSCVEEDEEHSEKTSARAKAVSLLKSLYRKIVRTLHPDSGYQMSPAEKILWQQTQTAYKTNDLETLKMISLKIEGKGNIIISKVEQIGELINLCKTLEQELTSLQNIKERNKGEPLYQFWLSEKQPKIRKHLKYEIAGDLERQTYRLKSFLREANQELEFLARKYR